MSSSSPEHRTGLVALAAMTELLRRIRASSPTDGLYEAADLQWWWRTPRSSDHLPQLVWFDRRGRPEAAVLLTDWGDRVAIDPFVLPDSSAAWIDHVVATGLAHAADLGLGALSLEVRHDDAVLLDIMASHGFEDRGEWIVEAWLVADDRPAVAPLHAGYRSTTRAETTDRPHHLAARSGPDVEQRLRQTSLYRPELDLVVMDRDDEVAAYGLFWYDPVTHTGLVEPMRTEDAHQRRGLARHVLTTGLDLLARSGAMRIKICFEPDNPPARDLYLDVGFEPVNRTHLLALPAAAT